MKQSELLRLLQENGVIFLKHGKRHDIYYSGITKKSFPVPRHAKEIATGTANKILKDAGLE